VRPRSIDPPDGVANDAAPHPPAARSRRRQPVLSALGVVLQLGGEADALLQCPHGAVHRFAQVLVERDRHHVGCVGMADVAAVEEIAFFDFPHDPMVFGAGQQRAASPSIHLVHCAIPAAFCDRHLESNVLWYGHRLTGGLTDQLFEQRGQLGQRQEVIRLQHV
jgi:hypothetical protein